MTAKTNMRSKAVLFGINYTNNKDARLRGCINDVHNMADYLIHDAKYESVKIYTDEYDDSKVKGQSIMNSLYKLVLDSHRFNLERVWIHFSGHGCGIKDYNSDEKDGKDECILPSDYQVCGMITDDSIKRILRYFNPDTKVTCVFDCCHSGTIGDLHYRYVDRNNWRVENEQSKCRADVLLVSGCMDNQTSADAYNVRDRRQFSGAMTSCLLVALRQSTKVMDVVDGLRDELKKRRFTQIPQISSSRPIDPQKSLVV